METVRYRTLPEEIDISKLARDRGLAEREDDPVVAEIRLFKRFDYRVDWARGFVFVMDRAQNGPVPPCVAEVQIEKKNPVLVDKETWKAYAIEKAKEAARKQVRNLLLEEEHEIGD